MNESEIHVLNFLSARLKRFDPQIWLPTLTLFWGIVSICQGLVTNKAGLFGIRFRGQIIHFFFKGHVPDRSFLLLVLGVSEAGLFPGVIYLFSVYYRRHERSWRVAIFFGGAALAGAFGGILAYAIGKMHGVGGRTGWQWYEPSILSEHSGFTLWFSRIFILEGILTVAISLLAYFIVPTWSHRAKFVRCLHYKYCKMAHIVLLQLTEAEKKRLFQRLNADSDAALIERFKWVYVRQALTDHLVWAYAFLFHGFAFVLYSLSLFLVKNRF